MGKEKSSPSSKLEMPGGVSHLGMVKDLEEAKNLSLVAVSEIAQLIAQDVCGIAGSLEIISTYFLRKGIQDSLFTPEDIKDIDAIMNPDDDTNETQSM